MNSEIARLLAVKNAISTTTNSQGWSFVRGIADNMVQQAINEALDEEDRGRREDKTLKAAALRRGFADFFRAVDSAKTIDPEADFDTGLGELEMGETADA